MRVGLLILVAFFTAAAVWITAFWLGTYSRPSYTEIWNGSKVTYSGLWHGSWYWGHAPAEPTFRPKRALFLDPIPRENVAYLKGRGGKFGDREIEFAIDPELITDGGPIPCIAVATHAIYFGWTIPTLLGMAVVILVAIAKPFGRMRSVITFGCILGIAGVAILWIRSANPVDTISYVHASPKSGWHRAYALAATHGCVKLENEDFWVDAGGPGDGWNTGLSAAFFFGDLPSNYAGFGFKRHHFSSGYSGSDGWNCCFPIWLLMVPLLIPPVLHGRRLVRRQVASSTECPKCGYDLRATPLRCPECGFEVAATL